MARLKEIYKEKTVPELMKRFAFKSVMQVPKLEKIVVNMGVKEGINDIKVLDAAKNELALITGQRPKTTRATKAISAFKLREGMPIGCCVTLRGAYMYEFLDRLINIAIPRVRDFRGISPKSFDGFGNFSMGVREHLIFTELDYDKIHQVRGLNITAVTTAKTDEQALELLKSLGMPFKEH